MAIIKYVKLPNSNTIHDIGGIYDINNNAIINHYATNQALEDLINLASMNSSFLTQSVTNGSGSAYTITLDNYVEEDGAILLIKLHQNSIEGATLKINNGVAKPLIFASGAPIIDDLVEGTWLLISYSASLNSYIIHSNVKPNNVDEIVEITESGTYIIPSGVKKLDLFLVGGGHYGNPQYSGMGPPYQGSSTAGGNGGNCLSISDIDVTPGQEFVVVIGSGGTNKSSGGIPATWTPTQPGNTTFGSYSSANGTSGGTGGGSNGSGTSNTNGLCPINNIQYAGGGGGGYNYTNQTAVVPAKGVAGGGNGAYYGASVTSPTNGSPNTGGGGGGGLTYVSMPHVYINTPGGYGGTGIAILHIRSK